jgi:maltodextrin utilization protein YvdJ
MCFAISQFTAAMTDGKSHNTVQKWNNIFVFIHLNSLLLRPLEPLSFNCDNISFGTHSHSLNL